MYKVEVERRFSYTFYIDNDEDIADIRDMAEELAADMHTDEMDTDYSEVYVEEVNGVPNWADVWVGGENGNWK